MGDELRIPDKRGIVIPVAAVSVLVGVLVTLGGLLVQAGRILEGQAAQNREWQTIKAKIEAVDELEGKLAAIDYDRIQFQGVVARFMQDSVNSQAESKATLISVREDLSRQGRDLAREHRLLQDYVEGRIGTMPYRRSIPNRGPEE